MKRRDHVMPDRCGTDGRRSGCSGPGAKAPPRPRRLGPPTLAGTTAVRIPFRWRADAMQEAWLAYLEGRDANAAVWAYLKRVRRRETKCPCFSQLAPEQWREVLARPGR
jgi:hypothetical protein